MSGAASGAGTTAGPIAIDPHAHKADAGSRPKTGVPLAGSHPIEYPTGAVRDRGAARQFQFPESTDLGGRVKLGRETEPIIDRRCGRALGRDSRRLVIMPLHALRDGSGPGIPPTRPIGGALCSASDIGPLAGLRAFPCLPEQKSLPKFTVSAQQLNRTAG
jgi:hypothetical protein